VDFVSKAVRRLDLTLDDVRDEMIAKIQSRGPHKIIDSQSRGRIDSEAEELALKRGRKSGNRQPRRPEQLNRKTPKPKIIADKLLVMKKVVAIGCSTAAPGPSRKSSRFSPRRFPPASSSSSTCRRNSPPRSRAPRHDFRNRSQGSVQRGQNPPRRRVHRPRRYHILCGKGRRAVPYPGPPAARRAPLRTYS